MTPQRCPRQKSRFHAGASWLDQTIKSVDIVGAAIADVAIRPTLLQHRDLQVLAYFDDSRNISLAERNIRGLNWEFQKIESRVGWDSHNYIDLGFDRSGRLHIAGNMHASPLQYWTVELQGTSRKPRRLDVAFDSKREQRITYPRFLRDGDGQLLFTYRDGTSGDGDFICLRWNDEAARYERMTDRPLIEGRGQRNAYIDTNAPILGPDGDWHMLWVWRDSPDAESTHTVNYAQSADLVNWKNAAGTPISHPIADDADTVVDPVPPGGGLINNNVRLGFLPNGRPLAIYHKRDGSTSQQIWAAAFDGVKWAKRPLTDWSYRWDFAGQGSLDFQIEIGPPATTGLGITVDIRHDEEVETFAVNEELTVTGRTPASPWNPLRRLLRADGLYDRVTLGRGWAPGDPGAEWLVTHTSVPEQRDKPPTGQTPISQPLSIVETYRSDNYAQQPAPVLLQLASVRTPKGIR